MSPIIEIKNSGQNKCRMFIPLCEIAKFSPHLAHPETHTFIWLKNSSSEVSDESCDEFKKRYEELRRASNDNAT